MNSDFYKALGKLDNAYIKYSVFINSDFLKVEGNGQNRKQRTSIQHKM